MTFRKFFGAATLSATLSSTAYAQIPDGMLAKICVADGANPGKRVVDTQKLVRLVEQNHPRLPNEAMDLDENGRVSARERLQVYMEGRTNCKKLESQGICSKEDVDAWGPVSEELGAYITSFNQDSAHFRITPEGAFSPEDLLLPGSPVAKIYCTGEMDEPPATVDQSEQWSKQPIELRLGKDKDALLLPRKAADDLAAVPEAKISFTDDAYKGQNSLAIDAAVGFELGLSKNATYMPFMAWKRARVRDVSGVTGVSVGDDVDTIQFGVAYSHYFATGDRLSIAPLYTIDNEKHSRIGSIHAAWRPGFLLRMPGFGGTYTIGGEGNNAIGWKLGGQLLADAGHVYRSGTNTDLVQGDSYLRAGGEYSVIIWPLLAAKPFAGTQFTASYKHMFRLSGKKRSYQFHYGISFPLDAARHFTITYGYDRGYQDETLDPVMQKTISFGVRF